MNAPALWLLPVLLIALIALGQKARKRRTDANLGDMFLDAIKDRSYALLIVNMAIIVTLIIVVSLVFL